MALPFLILDAAIIASAMAQISPSLGRWVVGARPITNQEWIDRLEKIYQSCGINEKVIFEYSPALPQIEIFKNYIVLPESYLGGPQIESNEQRWDMVAEKKHMIYTPAETNSMIASSVFGAATRDEQRVWAFALGGRILSAFIPARIDPKQIRPFVLPRLLVIAGAFIYANYTNFQHRVTALIDKNYAVPAMKQLQSELHYNKTFERPGIMGHIRYSSNGTDRFSPYPNSYTMLSMIREELHKDYIPPLNKS